MVGRNRLAGNWREELTEYLSMDGTVVHLIGIGNQMRGDDAAGLYIAGELHRRYGGVLPPSVTLHPVKSNPEHEMSRIDLSGEKLVIFDAAECNITAGGVICARLSDSRYGFFSTHNVPLRLLPPLAGHAEEIAIVGIQPRSTAFGVPLSTEVRRSADEVVEVAARALGVA